MPKDKDLYLPVFVGKDLHPKSTLKFQGDNEGENISKKNRNFNELTAIYWAWKNLDADAIGLVHYRRYLSLKHSKNIDTILDKEEVETLLQQSDIILPKKRKYYIETNYSHYEHAHHIRPLNETRNIIASDYPEYIKSFDDVMNQTSAHMFNMFVMKKKEFDEYCTWLFDILFKLEKKIDITDYNTYESRVFGFVSERLLDVWINTKNYSYQEVNFVFMERQNWFKKGFKFLWRKFV